MFVLYLFFCKRVLRKILTGNEMKKIFSLLFSIVVLSSCQTSYLTKEGERLLGNVASGCIFGEVFFDDCKAGAAVTGAATIIDNQN